MELELDLVSKDGVYAAWPPTVKKEGSLAVEQASVTRFPPLLGGSGGASGAIIPKQL
jgi:hypothetical protein